MKRFNILWLITFFALVGFVHAQEPFVSESWHVMATNGHYGSNPKISSEFQLSAPGIIKIDASVTPFCVCGKAGYQYFVYQHRAKNSSGDWTNGAAYLQEYEGVVYTHAEWVDGKRLSWTWQWKVLPQAENYNYRILLFPNAYWTGNGHYTPEQILNISITLVSSGGGNGDTNRITWATQADNLRGRNGERFTYICPGDGTISPRLWGTNIYTDDSSICSAAVHAGLINAQSGGTVTIEIRAGASSYQGSFRNGATSKDYGGWHGSFIFVKGTNGGNTEFVNLALNRPARQSSLSEYSRPNDAQGAVDGVKNGGVGFHTSEELNPWWQVDLGVVKNLTEIRVFNRTDCCSERAKTLQILLSADGRAWQRVFVNSGNNFNWSSENPLKVSVAGNSARYVKLQLNERNWFHLDEVEIY